MTPFTQLSGIAAPLSDDNIDTDIIYPARFLLITAREGLGKYAFHDHRYAADGAERAEFILNREPWREACILVAGANFGSGSSREQAVWALLGAGIRCVIATSFGEIFQGNCYRNGVLPIVLGECMVSSLQQLAGEGQVFTVNLETRQIEVAGLPPFTFAVGDEQRQALLNGWDETEVIFNLYADDMAAFEQRHRVSQPWLFATGAI
jgi:3-isopropylmalate/(R)-2-methylmalate dehydratase small subunit